MDRLTEGIRHPMVLDRAERTELMRLTKYGPGGGATKVITALLPGVHEDEHLVVPGLFVGRFALQSGRVLDIASRLIAPDHFTDVLRAAGYLPARLDRRTNPR